MKKNTNPPAVIGKEQSGAPTNTMVIRGLEKYGYNKLAKEIALKHLDLISKIYKETGTIWENYAPDTITPGKLNGNFVKKSFCRMERTWRNNVLFEICHWY